MRGSCCIGERWRYGERHAAPNKRGAAGLTPPPLDLLLPGGGDGCRVKASKVGTGRGPVPWFGPPAGATVAGDTPHLVPAFAAQASGRQGLLRSFNLLAQALPSRSA